MGAEKYSGGKYGHGMESNLWLSNCSRGFCLVYILRIVNLIAAKNNKQNISDDELRCISCSIMYSIPRKSINSYPKYYQNNLMQDVFLINNSKKSQPDINHCGMCKNDQRQVLGFCFTCVKLICDWCQRVHRSNQKFTDHVLVQGKKDNINNSDRSPRWSLFLTFPPSLV